MQMKQMTGLGLLRLLGRSWKLAHFGVLDRLRLVLLVFSGVCEFIEH